MTFPLRGVELITLVSKICHYDFNYPSCRQKYGRQSKFLILLPGREQRSILMCNVLNVHWCSVHRSAVWSFPNFRLASTVRKGLSLEWPLFNSTYGWWMCRWRPVKWTTAHNGRRAQDESCCGWTRMLKNQPLLSDLEWRQRGFLLLTGWTQKCKPGLLRKNKMFLNNNHTV